MKTTFNETDWWWIDYLENELDPALERELESLLKHSTEDQNAFESFRLLKRWLAESDPVDNPALVARMPRLHARIMSAINPIPPRTGIRREPELDATC